MLHNILESVALLSDGLHAFNSFCAVGIEPNLRKIKQNLDGSLMLVTALNPHIGYEKVGQDLADGLSRGHDAARRRHRARRGRRGLRRLGPPRRHDPPAGRLIPALAG